MKNKLSKENEEFLVACNLFPHYDLNIENGTHEINALKIVTEHDEGAFLSKNDIAKLIVALTEYIK